MPSLMSKSIADFIQILKVGSPEWGITPHNAPDLIDRWSIDMECQINIQSALGSPVEDRKGVFVDQHGNEFWNIRIPKGANTDEATFTDRPMGWALPVFAAGFGCTGWDWRNKVSRWVAFDFDALVGHAAGVGVAQEELDRVKEAASQLPWVETRKSTGGSGLHLYVPLDAVPTSNHTVHAALARCILGMMGTETGFDFGSRIDACGGNTWIWHRKMTPANDGLKLIKPAECSLSGLDLPTNWRDNVDVVKRKRSKVAVQGIENESSFDKLAGAQQCVQLDDKHRECIAEVGRMGYANEWVSDHNCWRTHTRALAELRERMPIKGVFRTTSEGRDPGTANVFGFPLPNGGWRFFRFSPGVSESPTWNQDGQGWTSCAFNVMPDLKTAARAEGGVLDGDRGGYIFSHAYSAIAAIKHMGQEVELPPSLTDRDAYVHIDKSGHVSISIARESSDKEIEGWVIKAKRWYRSTEAKSDTESSVFNMDVVARYIVSGNQEVGWELTCQGDTSVATNKDNIKTILIGQHGFKRGDTERPLSNAILNPWRLVCVPFEDEYPGKRQINRGAAKLLYQPSYADDPHHPTWDLILAHCFQGLDAVLPTNEWAIANGIRTGRDYGFAWFQALIQAPFQPLPYLFLFSEEQNTGKSILWESLQLLIDPGVVNAARALRTVGDFNGELAGAVVGYIEEIDVSRGEAYNRMKAWLTSPTISIREMRMNAYELPNCLHFIQTANSRDYCPILPGDTRITMMYVPPPAKDIPKMELKQRLIDEAPDFLTSIKRNPMPSTNSRLRIPCIETEAKRLAMRDAVDPLQEQLAEFIAAECEDAPGKRVATAQLLKRFNARYYSDEKPPLPARIYQHLLALSPRYVRETPGKVGYIKNLILREVTA